MVSRIIKVMIIITVLSIIISGFYMKDILSNFNSQELSQEYMNKHNYHFIAIIPEKQGNVSELLKEGIKKADSQFNIITEIYTTKNFSEHSKLIKMAILSNVDGILLWPTKNGDFNGLIKEVRYNNIPIVLVSNDYTDTKRNSFIGFGKSSVRAVVNDLINKIDGQGHICILNYSKENKKNDSFINTFNNISDKYNSLTVQTEYIPNDKYIYMVDKIKKTLEGNPFIDALFCLDSQMSKAAINALNLIDRTNVIVMGYEDFEKSEEYIETNQVYTTFYENSNFIGYVAVRYLRDINRGNWVPETLDSGININIKNNS